jgi:HK97 gp10 family phage protein
MASRIERREALLRKLKALPPQARSRMRQAIAEGADEIVAMQKRLVPVRTGKLRDSIKATFGAKPAGSSAGLSAGGAVAGDPDLTVWITAGGGPRESGWYARFVEFGTAPHTAGGKFENARHPGTKAQPFFYPAYRALRRRTKARITRAITKSAREVAAKS